MTDTALLIVFLAILVFFWLFYIHIPMKMAWNRGRSALGWILVFWVTSPLIGVILLLILGDSSEKIANDLADKLKR